jgi:hypothetical protein
MPAVSKPASRGGAGSGFPLEDCKNDGKTDPVDRFMVAPSRRFTGRVSQGERETLIGWAQRPLVLRLSKHVFAFVDNPFGERPVLSRSRGLG